MGEQKVTILKEGKDMQRFVRHLLDDVQALEYMLDNDWFEDDIVRIGAEQEMCMVFTKNLKPAPIAVEALELMKDLPWVETELARFNLETNLLPRTFTGNCLRDMEQENKTALQKINERLSPLQARAILTGILPTLRKYDMEMHNLTPKKRYKALMEAINSQLVDRSYEVRLEGIDELLIKHDSPMIEACNTSFQVHLQVAPKDFVKMYNIAQTIAAPVMAIAANSPIVFGKRLWHESRIALFQQALDTRSANKHLRERSPRVHFGKDWLKRSILEIYQEDIARFRVLISGDVEENALELIKQNKVPKLRALQVHNSTVYRWNRPCYGISESGKPHLRIENRILPAGPTVIDEMANTAFWLGTMVGMSRLYRDITEQISFADVRDNFGKAAQFGIDSSFTWFKDKKISAEKLILEELLPCAREGLQHMNVNPEDIDRYLGVIEERAKAHTNGARWALRAYTKLKEEVSTDESLSILTTCMLENQEKELPVHKWKQPETSDLKEYRPSDLKVEEFMVTDVFTVQKVDIIDLVAEMMNWRKIRHMPVEDAKGNLVGLVTSRLLLRYFTQNVELDDSPKEATVGDIMVKNPITIRPGATILEAMVLMRKHKIGCLPVVNGKELIGLITEMDFLRITSRLMERLDLKEEV